MKPASSSAGTFSINNYQFDGTVSANITATPEARTLALLGIGASLLLLNQRRKRFGKAG